MMRIIRPFLSALAIILSLSLFPSSSIAQNVVSLVSPLPLEVRSPYLNFWTAVQTSASNTTSADFFFTEAFAGRTVLLRIDGVTHSVFGPLTFAGQSTVTGSSITPTRTIFTLQVGSVGVTVTFFSPIEPGDWVRQSIPFTYLSLDLNVTDGHPHDIQLYVHMQSGDFLATNAVESITWSTVTTGQSVYEVAQLQNQQLFSENTNAQAEWGQIYFATAQSDAVTYDVGSADTLISIFSGLGSLNTLPDSKSPVTGVGNTTTAFALARNLGTVTANASAAFAFGFVQDPAVQYVDPSGQSQLRVPYYKTSYSSPDNLIDAFIGDYADALSRGIQLEEVMANDTAQLPPDYYSTLLCLTTRLAYASTVLTVRQTSKGVLDSTDVMMFMKNIDTASDTNRVNPVEVLYNAFPMFMYFDPDLGGLLLEPLLRYQASSSYTKPYAALDAGTLYPNTSFTNAAHPQGVEQTANMLIMMYAHALASGDGNLIATYPDLMKKWTDYLIGATLYTTNQESADLLNINNQTNLAIKGIIAIMAMSFMSSSDADSTNYSTIAHEYYNQWTSLALASDKHLLVQYGDESSWSLGYNMFADIWLQTGLISQDIFTAHVNFLKTVNITSAPLTLSIAGVGIPLDSLRIDNVTYSSNMFAAGFADTKLQRLILSGMESHPEGEDISIFNTTFSAWSASPDLGSAYAPLMLSLPILAIVSNVNPSHGRSTGQKLGIAFGSLFGCALLAGLLVALFLFLRRRRRARHNLYLRRVYLGRRRRRSNANDMAATGDSVSLDFMPSLGMSKSMEAESELSCGWKNLEDYEYED
ncbi:hypothetical protein F5148DRAFT_1205922 [Russula earlei]|uniref:Uncharacterized protein n=1 Tax=Russula earlei TaxID=71964 RepID=A0ACC0U7L2_9AGAM|nr:hypothetical protein F5148DRAFT_1205922 [Russula earlei]